MRSLKYLSIAISLHNFAVTFILWWCDSTVHGRCYSGANALDYLFLSFFLVTSCFSSTLSTLTPFASRISISRSLHVDTPWLRGHACIFRLKNNFLSRLFVVFFQLQKERNSIVKNGRKMNDIEENFVWLSEWAHCVLQQSPWSKNFKTTD